MRNQVLSLILLAVLIPLLNLGPSLHHLSCFGLHGGCEECHYAAKHSCCDGHCVPVKKAKRAFSVDVLTVFTASDCPLCQFFAHYNAIDYQYSIAILSHGFCEVFEFGNSETFSEFIPEQARGPPIRSFVLFS